MNETDPELLDKISARLISMRQDYWIDIHWLRFWKSGEGIFIDFHLILPYYFNIKQSHQEEEIIEEELRKELPASQIKVHMDYCNPLLCKICSYSACEVRNEEKIDDIKWDTDKLIGEPIIKVDHIT